jgi:hypothetical protein
MYGISRRTEPTVLIPGALLSASQPTASAAPRRRSHAAAPTRHRESEIVAGWTG